MSPLARLSPSSLTYPPPDAGLYVVRPPGNLPPRKVRALTDILLEYFGAGQSRAAPKLLPNHYLLGGITAGFGGIGSAR